MRTSTRWLLYSVLGFAWLATIAMAVFIVSGRTPASEAFVIGTQISNGPANNNGNNLVANNNVVSNNNTPTNNIPINLPNNNQTNQIPVGNFPVNIPNTNNNTTVTNNSTNNTSNNSTLLNNSVNLVTNNTTNNTTINNTPTTNNTSNNTANNLPAEPAPLPTQPVQPAAAPSQNFVDRVVNSPTAKTAQAVTNDVVAPTLAVVATVNLAVAATVTDWYPLLLRIFLEPGQILFRRKRRRAWGGVYNSLTKRPVDLAIVRLLGKDGRPLATRVTDRFGRYQFLPLPGQYRLVVTKANYTFPSKLLQHAEHDETYRGLNYGESFAVTNQSLVQSNVPIDPPEQTSNAKIVLRRFSKNTVHNVIAYFGLGFGILAVIVAHTWLAYALMLLHVLVFAFFSRLAKGRKPKPWGLIYDRKNSKPLARAVVRIHDGKYNRILEQQVSDRAGRFGFLVGRSNYYLDAVKDGYRFPASGRSKKRDYIGGMIQTHEGESQVAVDIPMDPLAAGETFGRRTPLNPTGPIGPIAPEGPTV